MIDQFLTLLGLSNNYYLFGLFLAGGVTLIFIFEFLHFLSFLFKKLGGF